MLGRLPTLSEVFKLVKRRETSLRVLWFQVEGWKIQLIAHVTQIGAVSEVRFRGSLLV
jgi:hypothetical protein